MTLRSVEAIGAPTVLDIFSGIGGFSLGLERAGFVTEAFCENNENCARVLRHHWPEVPIFGDVHELTADRLGRRPFLIAGGFPCQPHSSASRGRKVAQDLWPEFRRLVGECRPDWVAAENVPGIEHDGVDRVSRDLEDVGYTVWAVRSRYCVTTEAAWPRSIHLAGPHQRKRRITTHRACGSGQRMRDTKTP